MNQEVEQRVRELAYSLWQSAEQPYWTALEYWLMAEHMILGLILAANQEGGVRISADQTARDPATRSGTAVTMADGNGAGG